MIIKFDVTGLQLFRLKYRTCCSKSIWSQILCYKYYIKKYKNFQIIEDGYELYEVENDRFSRLY